MSNDKIKKTEVLLKEYDISKNDLELITAAGKTIIPGLKICVDNFYIWLRTTEDFDRFFSDAKRLARVRSLQTKFWEEFFKGIVNDSFVSKRVELGKTHAMIGLPIETYFTAESKFFSIFQMLLNNEAANKIKSMGETISAIAKLIHLETSLVVQAYVTLSNEKITKQSNAIMEMSTPVSLIWEKVLLMPIVGMIDSGRAQNITNAMLTKISETRAKVIILDISGVAVVDTAVANHIIKISQATKLMGCNCTLSGISAAIAQTMVDLGVNIGSITTTATLRDALESAFETIGLLVNESS